MNSYATYGVYTGSGRWGCPCHADATNATAGPTEDPKHLPTDGNRITSNQPLKTEDERQTSRSTASVAVNAEMVVLWLHGNAGNISYRYDMIRAMMDLAVKVFIIDYRGYGKSEGAPNEQGLYLDARAAWDYLINQRGVAPKRIVIFGKSLGGVPAIDLAGRVVPAGLIVQSTFTSAGDMVAYLLPFLPRVFLRTKMGSVSRIDRVHCPKLFIHSRADEVIPYELGRRLYEAVPEPKEFYEVKGAPHNSTYIIGGKRYFDALRRFIQSCSGMISES